MLQNVIVYYILEIMRALTLVAAGMSQSHN